MFGDRLELACRYADLLATDGSVRGLIGPREVPRLWERHLINSAVIGEVIDAGASVVDVGSGAGLPGIPLALARPDLPVTLLEPLLRRAIFLEEVVEALGLSMVSVVRGRAEQPVPGLGRFDVVTARAVAPLERLVTWCLPLVAPGGEVVAMKGASAEQEVAAATGVWRKHGWPTPEVVECGAGIVSPPTTVVRVRTSRTGRARRTPGPGRPPR